MDYGAEYRMLIQEGHLTKSSLLGGLDSIRNANIDDRRRGLFYSGLFELSTGFERLMKVVFILDYKIKNNLKSPTFNEVNGYGHKVDKLFGKCSEILVEAGLSTETTLNEHQRKIISTLSNFAKASRYHNLDVVTGSKKQNADPIVQWVSIIEDFTWGLRMDFIKRAQGMSLKMGRAGAYKETIGGEYVTEVDFYFSLIATEKVNGHLVWMIIDILQPFYYLLKWQYSELSKLSSKSKESIHVPAMYEFFSFLLTPKKSVLRRKRWPK